MQRLTSVHPSDLTKFPDGRGTISLPASNAGTKVVMYNETPLNIDLDFLNGTSDVLHAWEANYWTLDGNVDEIDWNIDVDSLNVTNPPINAVFLTIYQPSETLRDKTYPMALVRQLGGQQAIVSGSSSLVNTGNVAGTSVVQTNSTAAVGDTWDVTNDGLWTIAITIAGALVQFLKTQTADPIVQLGAAAHLVEILGNLKVDGTLESVGVFTADALVKANGGVQLPNNVALSALDASAVTHNILSVLANNHVAIGPAGSGIDQVDGSGNIILRTTSTAVVVNKVIQMLNNVAIQSADSGGTQRNMLFMDATNKTRVQSGAVGAEVNFQDSAGSQLGWFNSGGGGCANGTFQAPKLQPSGGAMAVSAIAFAAFNPPTGISTITHNFGFVPTVAIWQGGQTVNTNPGTTTAAIYNTLANTCTINNFAAVPGFLLYLKN